MKFVDDDNSFNFFLLSYKTSEPLSDSRELSTDEDVWGKPLVHTFSTAGEGKSDIDGQTATSHVLYMSRVAIALESGGLGAGALDLRKVVHFNNDPVKGFGVIKDSRSKWGPHRAGRRIWYYGSTEDYDQYRKTHKKVETLLKPDGGRILRSWFCFLSIDGKLYARRRSCFNCPMCYDSRFLKCTNVIACGKWVRIEPEEIEDSTRQRSFADKLDQPDGCVMKKVFIFEFSLKSFFEKCLKCESMGKMKIFFNVEGKHKCPYGATGDGIQHIFFIIFFRS